MCKPSRLKINFKLYNNNKIIPPIPHIIDVIEPNIKLTAISISFKLIGNKDLCSHLKSIQKRFTPHSKPLGLFLQRSSFAETKSIRTKNKKEKTHFLTIESVLINLN